jgi:multiple sugar transport system ATP-binding protein
VACVVVEHLTKNFEGPGKSLIRAVDDASLSVEDKELVVLIGPSGCGKTTMLRIIAGLEPATRGRILIKSQDVTNASPKERDVAMVFQNHALYPHMSAYDNMAFGLKLRRVAKGEIDTRVRAATEMLDLASCLNRKPAALSGGQRQRVALGRAIVRQSSVLLLDEPLSNLDAQFRAQLRIQILKLHKRLGSTMLYVTHDQAEAMSLGDRVAVMRNGAIQQVDTPAQVYQRPANLFVAGFIGSPPMNLFVGTLARHGSELVFNAATAGSGQTETSLRLPVDEKSGKSLLLYLNKKVVLGLRPEHVVGDTLRTNASAYPMVKALVEVVELLGPETHLHLAVGDQRFVARVPGTTNVQINQTIPVSFQMERARFFDAETENAISLS